MADNIAGFPPVATPNARVLVLGTAPSALSLQAGECYAHPRNAFWRIMRELLGQPADESYGARTHMLLDAGVALWDVLKSADRPGSLDAAIVAETAVVNDFAGFFADCPHVRAVFFNGKTARQLWERHVTDRLPLPQGLTFTTLPSTSPANTGLSVEAKIEAWRAVVDAAAPNPSLAG